jgi:hypothetical protein
MRILLAKALPLAVTALLLSGCAPTEFSKTASAPRSEYGQSSLEIVRSYPVSGMQCMDEFFDAYVDVFGIYVIGAGAPDDKLLHTAGVLAQYLDNDSDGTPDDQRVLDYLVKEKFHFPVWTEDDWERFSATSCGADKFNMAASMYPRDEWAMGGIERSGKWDTNLEEVWHLVSRGFYGVYPEDFSVEESSSLTRAMDAARGGYFLEVPARYPASAWYSYDEDAPYQVHVSEYFYWAVVTNFGALNPEDVPDRCEQIKKEWRICTKADLEKIDPLVFELLNERGFKIPKIIPDGIYLPAIG